MFCMEKSETLRHPIKFYPVAALHRGLAFNCSVVLVWKNQKLDNSAMFISVFHLVSFHSLLMTLCHIQEPPRWLFWTMVAFLIWTAKRQMELISSSCGAPFSQSRVLLDLSSITEVR